MAVCRVEGNKGGKWDNCNSMINKIYLKREREREKKVAGWSKNEKKRERTHRH